MVCVCVCFIVKSVKRDHGGEQTERNIIVGWIAPKKKKKTERKKNKTRKSKLIQRERNYFKKTANVGTPPPPVHIYFLV